MVLESYAIEVSYDIDGGTIINGFTDYDNNEAEYNL